MTSVNCNVKEGKSATHVFDRTHDLRVHDEMDLRNLDVLLQMHKRELELCKLAFRRRYAPTATLCLSRVGLAANECVEPR